MNNQEWQKPSWLEGMDEVRKYKSNVFKVFGFVLVAWFIALTAPHALLVYLDATNPPPSVFEDLSHEYSTGMDGLAGEDWAYIDPYPVEAIIKQYLLFLFLTFPFALLMAWAFIDAEARNKSRFLVPLLVILSFPLGLVIWLVVRPERVA